MSENAVGEPNNRQNHWGSHNVAATILRFVILVLPITASLGAGILLTHIYLKPASIPGRVLWLLTLGVASSVVLFTVDRQMRRLLPLTALMKLTLVFPDKAPSRFRTAIRTGSTKQLEQRLKVAHAGGNAGESLNDAAVRILELAAMLTSHDRFTRGHCERVRAYADMLGTELHLSADDRNKLRWAAFLHDIGKLAVPAEILNKKGKPTAEEWATIKKHPLAGKELLTPLLGWLGPWANAAWEHHERWDGDGYPLRLAGTQISLSGRIVAVADSYEVMTATRSYKKPLSQAQARLELQRCAGKHFDPEVVRAMLNISIGRLRLVMGPVSWLAQLPLLSWIAPASAAGATAAPVAAGLRVAANAVIAYGALHAARIPLVTSVPEAAAQTVSANLTHTSSSGGSSTSGGSSSSHSSAASPAPSSGSSSRISGTPNKSKSVTSSTTTTDPVVSGGYDGSPTQQGFPGNSGSPTTTVPDLGSGSYGSGTGETTTTEPLATTTTTAPPTTDAPTTTLPWWEQGWPTTTVPHSVTTTTLPWWEQGWPTTTVPHLTTTTTEPPSTTTTTVPKRRHHHG